MEKELLLNKEGVKYKCIINGNNISFEFDNNLAFLNKFLSITKREDKTLVSIGMKQILIIHNDEITKVLPISSTEIRILRAYYNHFDSRSEDLISLFRESKDKIMRNNKVSNIKGFNKDELNNSELHTHLIEILSSKELIDYFNSYNILYPLNENGELDFKDYKLYSYKDIELNGWKNNLERCLSIDYKNSSFEELKNAIENRNQLMSRVINSIKENLLNDKEWLKQKEIINKSLDLLNIEMNEIDIKLLNCKDKNERNKLNLSKIEINNKIVKTKDSEKSYCGFAAYDGLFSKCLEKLKNENISYSEISYSNDTRIKYLKNKYKEEDYFDFLYSVDRNKNVKTFSNAAKNMESLLNDNSIIGIDIVGNEYPLNEEEYSSLKEKLEWILPVLHIYPNCILKVHANDLVDCTDNVLKVLRAIKETTNKINDCCSDLFGESWGVIPPPKIVLGYGANIKDNNELIHLIKDFDATIELNTSSNNSLDNDLDVKYYDNSNIKYVFVTEGSGMYYTSSNQENNQTPKQEEIIEEESNNEEEIVEETVSESFEHKKDTFGNFDIALECEDKLFMVDGNRISESEKINSELLKINEYINDNEKDIDSNYLNTKINIVKKYCGDKNLSEYAKMYLFLLENELFSDMDSAFKSIEYLYNLEFPGDRIESYLKRILNLVSEQYENDTKDYYKMSKK